MSLYVARHYAAELTETLDAEFVCDFCGHRAWARVSARGHGAGASPYFLDNEGAKIRAADEASRDALDVAHRALEGVACPHCGRRKRAGVDVVTIFLIVGPTIAGSLIGGLFAGERAALLGALAGGTIGLLRLFVHRRRAQHAGKDVEFFVGEPPDRPFVGKRCTVCARSLVTQDEGTRCQTCGAPMHHKKCARVHGATHKQAAADPPSGSEEPKDGL